MSSDREDVLKRQLAYEEWGNRTSLEETLLVWRFFVEPGLLTDWRLHRARDFDIGGGRRIEAIWTRAEGGAEEVLRMDVVECASLSRAHDQLLRLAAEFQSGALTRQANGAGDVAIGNGEFLQAFARANLIVMLRNAGPRLVSVLETARSLDGVLTARPPTSHPSVAPALTQVAPQPVRPRTGERVVLRFEATDPLGGRVWFKLFASGGRLELEQGEVSFTAEESGAHRLTLFALNENRGVASQTLTVLAQ